MKLFHISDLHIGKQLYRYHMGEEQRAVLAQITAYAKEERPDAILIAGDIYDSPIPSAEAVSILDGFLTGLSELKPQPAVLLIAGNHDSAKRLDFASSILAKHQVYIAGLPPMRPEEHIKTVTLQDAYGDVVFYLLPFVKPSYVRKLFPEEEIKSYDAAVQRLIAREELDLAKRNVILSHQFYTAGAGEPATCGSEVHFAGGIENVDMEALKAFEYAALGHIHRPQRIGAENCRYCGTPLQYSVSEAGEQKSITVAELAEKGVPPEIRLLPLHPLREVKKLTGTLEEVLAGTHGAMCSDFVSITLTDEVEAYQPRERLEERFDHILEIRVDNARTRKLLELSGEEEEIPDPYTAFGEFFLEMNGRELTEQEEAVMRRVILREMEGMEL